LNKDQLATTEIVDPDSVAVHFDAMPRRPDWALTGYHDRAAPSPRSRLGLQQQGLEPFFHRHWADPPSGGGLSSTVRFVAQLIVASADAAKGLPDYIHL
jgi:hypothetical protein